jgi:hypothetical protein
LDFKRKYSKIPCIPDSDMEIFSALPVRWLIQWEITPVGQESEWTPEGF